MKISELFQRCAFDAIDHLGQRICPEHEPQRPNSGEESDILHHTHPPQTGVPSGFKAIDCVTSGWQPSDLILVAARPSMGKTTFGLSMARNIAVDHGLGVAFFSLEMSAVWLMMRLITVETGLPDTAIKSGLSSEQQEYLESATKPLGTAPLFIDDTPALSVFEFRSKARRLKIHRPEYYGIFEDENGLPADGLAEFIIAKHRNGAGCNIKLRFLKEQVRFTDTLSDES